MEEPPPINCCPDYPNCKHAKKTIPFVMPEPSQLKSGTAFLPDGSPVVVITDMLTGQACTLSVIEATRLGMRLISLAEQAVTNALIYEAMCSRGTDPVEAFRFVEAFQVERHKVLRGEKTTFQTPSGK